MAAHTPNTSARPFPAPGCEASEVEMHQVARISAHVICTRQWRIEKWQVTRQILRFLVPQWTQNQQALLHSSTEPYRKVRALWSPTHSFFLWRMSDKQGCLVASSKLWLRSTNELWMCMAHTYSTPFITATLNTDLPKSTLQVTPFTCRWALKAQFTGQILMHFLK